VSSDSANPPVTIFWEKSEAQGQKCGKYILFSEGLGWSLDIAAGLAEYLGPSNICVNLSVPVGNQDYRNNKICAARKGLRGSIS
jgi:hypothetical protein